MVRWSIVDRSSGSRSRRCRRWWRRRRFRTRRRASATERRGRRGAPGQGEGESTTAHSERNGQGEKVRERYRVEIGRGRDGDADGGVQVVQGGRARQGGALDEAADGLNGDWIRTAVASAKSLGASDGVDAFESGVEALKAACESGDDARARRAYVDAARR